MERLKKANPSPYTPTYMKGKKGQSPAWILGIVGAIFIIVGAILLFIGLTSNKSELVGNGMIAIIIGVVILIIAQKVA